jgi:hypothetical protein
MENLCYDVCFRLSLCLDVAIEFESFVIGWGFGTDAPDFVSMVTGMCCRVVCYLSGLLAFLILILVATHAKSDPPYTVIYRPDPSGRVPDHSLQEPPVVPPLPTQDQRDTR